MVTANQKSIIDMYPKEKKETKHNSKASHQMTRENKRRKGKKTLQKQIQNN